MRIKVSLIIPDKAVFIHDNYKEILGQHISRQLVQAGLEQHYTFSDWLGPRKMVPGEGFWAVNRAYFSVASPSFDLLFFLAGAIINNQVVSVLDTNLRAASVEFEKVESDPNFKGYLWSPVVLFEQKISLVYHDNPALFSELLRHDLIEKHIQTYNGYPADDRLVVIFDADYLNKGGLSEIRIGNRQAYAHLAPVQLIGSRELVKMALTRGLGHYNTLGCGMVAEKLFKGRRRKNQ